MNFIELKSVFIELQICLSFHFMSVQSLLSPALYRAPEDTSGLLVLHLVLPLIRLIN